MNPMPYVTIIYKDVPMSWWRCLLGIFIPAFRTQTVKLHIRADRDTQFKVTEGDIYAGPDS